MTTYSDYKPLVKLGYTDYKTNYNPETNITYENGNALLTTSHPDLTIKKLKFFVPPGTKAFSVSYITYKSPEESKMAARFGSIPTITAEEIIPDTMGGDARNTLRRLTEGGEELSFYSPGDSGLLVVSTRDVSDDLIVSKGGYIYFNILSVPGGKIMSLKTILIVDSAIYRRWYDSEGKWDLEGNPKEGVVHTVNGIDDGSGSGGGGSSGGATQTFEVTSEMREYVGPFRMTNDGSIGYVTTGFRDLFSPEKLEHTRTVTEASSLYKGREYIRISISVTFINTFKIRVFIPPGTNSFSISMLTGIVGGDPRGLEPGYKDKTLAAKLHAPPTTTREEITVDMQRAQDFKLVDVLNRGEEIVAASPLNSGVLRTGDPTNNGRDFYSEMTEGGWLYMKVMPYPGTEHIFYGSGRYNASLTFQISVMKDIYDPWYANDAVWDENGNPKEGMVHTVEGVDDNSSSDITDLTDLKSSLSLWNGDSDTDTTTIVITPKPTNAKLGTLECSHPNILELASADDKKATFTIKKSSLLTPTTVRIGVDYVYTEIVLKPAGSSGSIAKQPNTTDTNTKQVLNFTLTRHDYDISGKSNTRFIIAARVKSTETWLFMSSGVWNKVSIVASANDLPYHSTVATPELVTTFSVPIHYTLEELSTLDIAIHFGYIDEDEPLQDLGVLWTKS